MRERRGDTASEGAMRARRDGSEHETTRRFCVRAFVDSIPSPARAGTLLPPSLRATHAARRNASGASLKSFTVPSPPHVSAPPSSATILDTPTCNTFLPPPLGAMNVCRSCAARTCCRCLPARADHARTSPSLHPDTSTDPTPSTRRRSAGGRMTANDLTAAAWPCASRPARPPPRRRRRRRACEDRARRDPPIVPRWPTSATATLRASSPAGRTSPSRPPRAPPTPPRGARRRREGIPQRQRIPRAGEFRPRRRHHRRRQKFQRLDARVPLGRRARRRGSRARSERAVRAPRRHHTTRRADRESSAPGTPRHRRDRRRRVGRRFVGRTGDCFDVSRFRRRVRPNRPASRSGRGDDARATVLGGVRCETPQHGGSGRRPREHDRLFRVRLDASSDDVAGGGRGGGRGGGVWWGGVRDGDARRALRVGGPIVETRRARRRRSNRRFRAPRFRAPRFLGPRARRARETRPTVRPTTTRPLAGGAPPGAPRSRSPPRVRPALASPRRRPDGVNPRRRDPSSPPRGRVDRAPPG